MIEVPAKYVGQEDGLTHTGDASPLFAAKISPPMLRSPSVRADQLAKVAQAREAKLLLVRAPAGYGKTTLVAAAIQDLEWQHVWYRLDALDADPQAFLCSLAQALRKQWPSFGDWLLEGAAESNEGQSALEMVVALVEELERTIDRDLFIVLDDYETLTGAQVFNNVLAALLDRLPPVVHMLVLSRRRPSFPTAKMALDGQLVEMTHSDLRFGLEQVAAVVERQTGTPPTNAAVEKLLHLTEGWAAGVLLAGKATLWEDPAWTDGSLSGRDLEREVFPYLAEQVYARQSRRTREFLRATCCLESMTASLAETVAGSRDARSLLKNLEADEIFTFTDPSASAYRYHPLFRRLLQTLLIDEEGEDAFRAVQRRTADGLARHGLYAMAVDLYLTIDQPQPPLAIIRERGHDVLDECSEALISRWADGLRNAPVESTGWASLLEGHQQVRCGHLERAREQLGTALTSLDGDEEGRYVAAKELAHCCFYAGDDRDSICHLRVALALAANNRQKAECHAMLAFILSSSCRWQELEETLAAFEGCGRGVSAKLSAKIAGLESKSALMRGDIRRALGTGEAALRPIRMHSPKQSTAGFLHMLANVNYFAARYERATRLFQEAWELCDKHHLAKCKAELEVTRGTLLAQEGHLDECLAIFDEALTASHLRSDPLGQVEIHTRRGTALRRSGSLDMAAQAFEQALMTIGDKNAVYDKLNGQLNLAFAEGLLGTDRGASHRIQVLIEEASESQLRFQMAKGRFFLGVLSARQGGNGVPSLGSSCSELLLLGQMNFLGQEFVANSEAAKWLPSAGDETLMDLMGAIAPQAGGPMLLADLAALGGHVGLLVMDMARLRLPARQAGQLMETLRGHPSRPVRDRARRAVLSGASRADDRLFQELTPREEEVLAVIAEGRSNEEIAERLFLAVATVKTHVHRILTKTGTGGRLPAAILYRQRSAASPSQSAAPNEQTNDEWTIATRERS